MQFSACATLLAFSVATANAATFARDAKPEVAAIPETRVQQSTDSADKAEPAWPQWRGPNRDGQVNSKSAWPDRIDASQLQQAWRVKLGPSYSGPIVAGDLVIVTETVDKESEWVRAVDRRTGETRWSANWQGAMSVPFFAKANGDWIRATPTYDGTHIYVGGIRDVLVCLEAKTGAEKWRVDFVKDHQSSLPSFGFVSSPLVTDKHVFVQAGGGICKLDKTDGKLIWRSLEDGGGMNGSAFSSPVLATLAGRNQLLVQSREELAGVDPGTGDVLWSEKIPTFRGMNILTPVPYKNSVFTSAYGGATNMFDVNERDGALAVASKWTNPATGYMSSPVVIGNHIYLHLRNQRFTCINLETGEAAWTTGPYGKYWSLVANGDRILALDERGDLLLIRATPEKFDLIDKRHISDEPTWAHLAVLGDEIFVRELNAVTAFRWQGSEKPLTNEKNDAQ